VWTCPARMLVGTTPYGTVITLCQLSIVPPLSEYGQGRRRQTYRGDMLLIPFRVTEMSHDADREEAVDPKRQEHEMSLRYDAAYVQEDESSQVESELEDFD
jgi:hypothetical protein